MSRCIVGVLLLLSISLCGIRAEEHASVEDAVRKLGDADPLKRCAATESLLAAREAARSPLETAAKSGSSDVKSRAATLLKALDVEPQLAKTVVALTSGKTMACDFEVTRVKGVFKGQFSGHTDSERYVSDVKIPTPAGDIDMHITADGTNVWSEWIQPLDGQKIVQKFLATTMLKMGSSDHLNPVDCLRDVQSRFVFTGVHAHKAGGELNVYEGVPKDGALDRQIKWIEELGGAAMAKGMRTERESMVRARLTFAKDALRKIELTGANDEPLFALTLSYVKLGVQLDEKSFTYSPPKDVEVFDMEEQLKTTREHK